MGCRALMAPWAFTDTKAPTLALIHNIDESAELVLYAPKYPVETRMSIRPPQCPHQPQSILARIQRRLDVAIQYAVIVRHAIGCS